MMGYFSMLFLFFHCCSGKHNVLLIISDDLRPTLGCYGDLQAYTPNINLLCKESVNFLNAYAQQALCAPSRNSFLTSRKPDTIRLFDFYSYWRESSGNFTTLPQYFKNHGYFTKSVGKVFHPGISSNFTDDQPYSWSCDPYHPPTEVYKDAAVCGSERTLRSNLVCPVLPQLQPGGTLPDLESLHEAKSFLQTWRQQKKQGQQFFLAVGFHKPHVPLKYPRNFLDFHPLDNATLPPDSWRPIEQPTVAWNHWHDVRRRDDIKALNISFPFGRIPDEWSLLIRQSYYAAVSYIDDLVGDLLKELQKFGLDDDTIIVFTSDHGWSLGEHGEWSKFSNYEAATRVPLIMRIPGLTNRAADMRSIEAPVELLDLFPTLADVTGLPPVPHCPKYSDNIPLCTQGTSLIPLIFSTIVLNMTKESDKPALSQYPRPSKFPSLHPNSDEPRLHEIRYMGYSIRTAQYRYTEWPLWRPWSPDWKTLAGVELYDHSIDPAEDINLANRQEFQNIRKKLSVLLRARVNS